MLHSRLLSYLDEVARLGSMRKASARLNVASSAINRQILALEAELGTPLFLRLPRKLMLTTAGEIMIRHVRQTLKDMERVQRRIEELKGLRRGEITLAIMSGLAANMVPRIAVDFRRNSPRVKLTLRLLPTGTDIMAAVATGEADLGLGFDFPRDPALRVVAVGYRALWRGDGARSSFGGPKPAPPQRLHGLSADHRRGRDGDTALPERGFRGRSRCRWSRRWRRIRSR